MILLDDINRTIQDGVELTEYPDSHHWPEDGVALSEFWRIRYEKANCIDNDSDLSDQLR